jgi:phosphonate transport system permease protein
MPLRRTQAGTVWMRRSRSQSLLRFAAWLAFLTLFFVSWRAISASTMWVFVIDAPQQAADIFSRMVPPRWAYVGVLLRPLWDTILIATFGTALAVVLALPLAFLAARNTSPAKAASRFPALVLLVSSRSINSLAWALLLVTIVGPGVFAGILAIALRSVGFLGKLFYEAIEEIDRRQVEAVQATGASPLQVLRIGILPQVIPAFVGVAVYRWDINIRESTVLGLVGAGGIGLQLQASINILAWRQVAVVLLLILCTVVVSELVTAKVRERII